MQKKLSKLIKVDLRQAWNHEAADFTNWLAQPENLDNLSNEIGIEIKPLKTEASVGTFKVDILAEEEGSGRKIIIENQLEDTNHDHLGKIITYASGYDAEVVIWIVQDAREEHERAIEWLNEHTDSSIGFFLIQIELWQIDDSNLAPKFNVIVSPNEWAKAITSGSGSDELSETKLQQLEFWTKFRAYAKQKQPHMRLQTPKGQHWYNVSVGSSDGHLSLTVNTRENSIACDLYIWRNKNLFRFLQSKKEEIEAALGKAEWIDAPIASRIKISKKVRDVLDPATFEPSFEWLLDQTLKFQKVFGLLLQQSKKITKVQ